MIKLSENWRRQMEGVMSYDEFLRIEGEKWAKFERQDKPTQTVPNMTDIIKQWAREAVQ